MMTELMKPARRDNTPLSEIDAAYALRLHVARARYGFDGPTAKVTCEIAFGELLSGGIE